jgi:ATP-dependent RNA helicase RhlE
VATPGRLIGLIDRRAVDLGGTRFLVLDQADQMLDIGFVHALRRIAPLLGRDRQTMMFSATTPKAMADLSRDYLTDPLVTPAAAGMTALPVIVPGLAPVRTGPRPRRRGGHSQVSARR